MSKRQQAKQALLPPIPNEPWHPLMREWIEQHEWYEREGRERMKRREDVRLALKELAQTRNAPFELDGYVVKFVGQPKTYTKPCASCPTRGQSEKRIEQHIKTDRLVPVQAPLNAA